MDLTFLTAGIIGVGPAMALMYWVLRDYTLPKVEKAFFDDRRVFFMLAMGLIIGAILYFFEFALGVAFILYALLFAVAEELMKLMILNFPKFQRRLDTQFYGLSLGLGIGGALGVGYAFYYLATLGSLAPLDYVLLITLAADLCLLHGSTGATLGAGVVKGLPFSYFSQAALVHIAFNLSIVAVGALPLELSMVPLAIGTVIVAYYFWYVKTRMIPNLVETEVKRFEAKATKVAKKVAK
ncbi:MAG TPA: hypothetical protein VEH08_04490 [Methanomassiliicoccales archaeon]|nr:hypothetical protein [Methanomassiliicoccales archaeon]